MPLKVVYSVEHLPFFGSLCVGFATALLRLSLVLVVLLPRSETRVGV